MTDKILIIATYDGRYDKLLNIDLPKLKIVQSENGLRSHVTKRHSDCLKYLKYVKDIIEFPDYVGINPNETDSFELIKVFEDNVLIGIKLDTKNNYYYIATLHDISHSKLEKRLYSGRIKKVEKSE